MRRIFVLSLSAGLILILGIRLATSTDELKPSHGDVAEGWTVMDSKAYAQDKLYEWQYKEWSCLNKLWTKESNWRVEAINPNGNHFGLGQMRNTKYRNLDGYRMIDWSIRYINHRYSGSSCKAFAHWQKHGWH